MLNATVTMSVIPARVIMVLNTLTIACFATPNPGDGIVQAISDFIHKSVGFTKNCFDLFNICLTISVGLIFAHHLVGIGIGTVLAVIGVGRAIAAFNHFFKQPMAVLSGMNKS